MTNLKKNSLLDLDDYKKKESFAKDLIPNQLIKIFSPITFENLGYPLQIDKYEQIIKYFDEMHDNKMQYFDENFKIDEKHSLLIHKITEIINKEKILKKKVFPVTAPLSVLKTLKIIESIKNSRNLNIFEIGNGSGYLGAFLIFNKFKYASTDCSMPFYLWQDFLYNVVARSASRKFIQMAKRKEKIFNEQNSVYHIPWWEFIQLYESTPIIDILIADHCLGEMDSTFLMYLGKLLRSSKESFKKDGYPIIISASPGNVHINSMKKIIDIFAEFNFFHFNYKGFSIFVDKTEVSIIRRFFYEKISKRFNFLIKQKFEKKIFNLEKHPQKKIQLSEHLKLSNSRYYNNSYKFFNFIEQINFKNNEKR